MINRALVTGARGFVGRNIVNLLMSAGVDTMATDVGESACKNIVYRSVNITCKEQVDNLIADYLPTAIIHLAGIACPTCDNIGDLYNVNVGGTENILNSVRKYVPDCKVVLASTAAVCVNSQNLYLTENAEYNPQNHYSSSKMVMELLAHNYKSDLSIKIARPFNIIGYGQKEFFLIPKLVKAYVQRQPIINVGNLETYRDYVDIDYASRVFVKLAITENDIEVLNICSGIGTQGKQILDILSEITGFSPKIEMKQEYMRQNEIMRMVGDPHKCNAFMNNEKKPLCVDEVIKDMIRKYRLEEKRNEGGC